MKPVFDDYMVFAEFMEIAVWWGEFFWCGKWAFFCWLAGFSPYLHGFPQIYRYVGYFIQRGRGGGVGGNKQDESRWNIFGKMKNTEDIIQGDNSVGQWFVLRDLGSIDKKLSSRSADFGR